MDSFEINKIIAAVLVTVLIVFGIGKISDIIFHVEAPKVQGYKVEVNLMLSLVYQNIVTEDIGREHSLPMKMRLP